MRVEFENITIKHFRCFTEEQTLVLNPTDYGLHFLKGRNDVEPRLGANGAGKSSVFMALCWCIYGKTPDNLRSPDIKSWSGDGIPTVWVDVTVDGNAYAIAREAKTNGLHIDGEKVGPDAAANLIGLSFETFTNTVLWAQGQPLFFDCSATEKMKLFADVLKLERWDQRSKAADDRVKELSTLKSEMEGELIGLTSALEQSQELLESTSGAAAYWEEDNAKRLSGLGKRIKELEDKVAVAQRQLDDADLAYDGAETEAKACRKQLVIDNAAASKALSAVAVAKSAVQQTEFEINEAKRAAEDRVCVTCGQPLTKKHKLHGPDLAHQLKSNKMLLNTKTEALELAYEVVERTLNHAESFEAEAQKQLTTVLRLRPLVAQLNAEIRADKESSAETINPHNEHVRALKKKISSTEAQIEELREDLSKAARQIERNKFWVKGFKDVKFYAIEEVLQELELVSSTILSEVGLDGWSIKYDIEKETKSGSVQRGINVTIHPAHGLSGPASVKWEVWSGGEGQRLRIVGALALSEVLLSRANVQTDLEILDEPTRHMTVGGANDLCEYLRDRAQQLKKNCWFVDHLTHETSKFSSVTTVVKQKTGSVIEQ